ncbi:hypothetical protein ACMFMG_003719 [Clarireedia jacksonii]
MHYRQWGLLNDEFSAHFLADGSLFRFELHDLDENGACADTEHFEDPQKRFAAVYHVDTMLVLDPGRAMELGKRSFTYFFDGKWGRPADLVVCPRLYSRLDKSLMAYWCVQRVIVDGVLAKPIEKATCAQKISLGRICVCQPPAMRAAVQRWIEKRVAGFLKNEKKPIRLCER